jgi:hypothetical protein
VIQSVTAPSANDDFPNPPRASSSSYSDSIASNPIIEEGQQRRWKKPFTLFQSRDRDKTTNRSSSMVAPNGDPVPNDKALSMSTISLSPSNAGNSCRSTLTNDAAGFSLARENDFHSRACHARENVKNTNNILLETPHESQSKAHLQTPRPAMIPTKTATEPEEWIRVQSHDTSGPATRDSACQRVNEVATLADDADQIPQDLIQAFEKMHAHRKSRLSKGGYNSFDQGILADGTWVDTTSYPESPWMFFFFQNRDKWIQLALLPKDYGRKAILLEPIAEAAEHSPICCCLERDEGGGNLLRLYFSQNIDSGDPILTERCLDLSGERPLSWNEGTLPTAKIRVTKLVHLSLFLLYRGLCLVGGSPTGPGSQKLFSLFRDARGDWKEITGPQLNLLPGNSLVLHSCDWFFEETGFFIFTQWHKIPAVYTVNEKEISKAEVRGWLDSSSAKLSMTVSKKRMNWHGLEIYYTAPMYRESGGTREIIGVVCQTVNNEVYHFDGHPWAGLSSPDFLCSIKEGTRFQILKQDNPPWELLFISTDNEVSRVHFLYESRPGEFKFHLGQPTPVFGEFKFQLGRPTPVFGDEHFTSTTNEISLPGPLWRLRVPRPERSTNKEDWISVLLQNAKCHHKVPMRQGANAYASCQCRSEAPTHREGAYVFLCETCECEGCSERLRRLLGSRRALFKDCNVKGTEFL